MELSEIKSLFPGSKIYCKPAIALSFPPEMLAIAAALEAVWCELLGSPYLLETEFTIEQFRAELDQNAWILTIYTEDNSYESERSFNIRVVRDRNDYNAQIF